VKIVDWTVLNKAERSAVLARPESAIASEQEAQVKTIIARVRTQGDAAVLEMTKIWDKAALKVLKVSKEEIKNAMYVKS
jgi:histidinol dehydrogenase